MTTVDTLNLIEEILSVAEDLRREERERLIERMRAIDDYGNRAEEAAKPLYESEPRLLSVDEYLALEEKSAIRHEFVGGLMHAMSGTTRRHATISFNVASACRSHVLGGPCLTFYEQVKLRLRVNDEQIFYYPDLMVTCDRRDRENDECVWADYPTLIVEVLSPSTEAIDRREKFLNYRQIDTVQEYVLIAQKRMEATAFRRGSSWMPVVVRSREAVMEFQSIGLSVPLAEIYRDTALV